LIGKISQKQILLLGLDFDDTLADSWASVTSSLAWVASHDSPESTQRLKESLHLIKGKTLEVQLNSFISNLNFENAFELYMGFYRREGLQKTTLNTGSRELLHYCKYNDIEVVVISAKTEKNLALSMSHLGLADIPIYGGCDNSKKSYLMKTLKLDLYVGDQESDVAAARYADVKVVYLSSEETINTLSVEPDYRITNISQTIEILRILQEAKKGG
jgi:phosphoglycolate phosphatase-like HAD superfamily hydrolase